MGCNVFGRYVKRAMGVVLSAAMIAGFSYPVMAGTTNNGVEMEVATQNQDEDGYTLLWGDEFSGDSLDTSIWNYETHEPGWVNNELQEYTDSEENTYLEDGKLVIKANKTTDNNGNAYYTSGKVTTQNKEDFKYGKVVVRAKVPEGQGLWPAIWMMPTEENLYGSWPKCGEIDIMENLGNDTSTCYGTIHYGNPHASQQGVYKLNEGSFSDEYHDFSVEWEPSEMRFYIDGVLYHTVNDWFTGENGEDPVTYPAPFDQPFYLQLNLAVGGDWPGYPDDTTDFDNAKFQIDYVHVYQKDSYDENVSRPEPEKVVLRDPDANGNYVNNGDFSVAEDLTDAKDWQFATANGGDASSEIEGNAISIDTKNEGTVDYSVQLLQGNIPLEKGGIYKLSFDAYASEPRQMAADIGTIGDRSWTRYLEKKVPLTTMKQTYEYELVMEADDYADGRIEFNMGNFGSNASIFISNVKLERTGTAELLDENVKTLLSDGNYIYNGAFQTGTDRMQYWDVENTIYDASVGVTNENNVRELKAEVPDGNYELSRLKVSQGGLALLPGKKYMLSFDAYGDKKKTIQAVIDGKKFCAELGTSGKTYEYEFTTSSGLVQNTAQLVFWLGNQGTTYLDNVTIKETGLLINGDFSTETMVGWSPFADSSVSSNVSYQVNANKEAEFTIGDSGKQDWMIQLKQEGIKLENGTWYEVSYQAKSTLDREIMCAVQYDGNYYGDDVWTGYSGNQIASLTSDYKTYTFCFQMKEPSDDHAMLTFSMGAVNGNQIMDSHVVTIDNVTLTSVENQESGTDRVQPEAPGYEKTQIPMPSVEGTYIYNKKTQTASIAKNEAYTITGNKGKNAGIYMAAVTLKDPEKTEWKDGTTAPLLLTWKIQKAVQKITVSSVTKKLGSKAFRLKAKTSGDGKLTYTSNNKKVAVIGKTTGKVTIRKKGKTRITIIASETKNYKKAKKKIVVTVKRSNVG